MNSSNPSMPQAPLSQALTRLWHTPTLTVARFTLRSYVRSGWILGDIVVVWLLYAAFFLEFGGNVKYFYETAGQGLYALAILSSIIMTQRAMQARVYLPLARLSSRSAYVQGIILATGLLRVPTFLLMLLLGGGYHTHIPILGIQGATVSNMLPGALGVLLNCITLSTLTVVLSIPVATRRIQIVFLAWLAVVLYSNSSPALVAQYLAVTRLPLAPFAACHSLGATGIIDGYGFFMVILEVGYIVGLTLLADFWLKKRDLILL